MTIITAGDKKFKKFIGAAQKQCEKFGYPMLIYDLGGLGFGIPFDATFENVTGTNVIKNKWKPSLILDAFYRASGEMVWMDADAILWNTIDIDWDFDIGVTLRRQGEIDNTPTPELTGGLNSGVVFINKTSEALDFLQEWEQRNGKTDQQALNSMVEEVTGFTKYNTIFKRKGVKIKIFTTDRYNCYYFDQSLNSTDNRILHFKKDVRDIAPYFLDRICQK